MRRNMYGVDGHTLLLLHFDGDFKDAAGNFTLENSGAVIDTAEKKFGTGSGKFEKASLVFPEKEWLNNLLQSGNYTIEVWAKTKEGVILILCDDVGGDTHAYKFAVYDNKDISYGNIYVDNFNGTANNFVVDGWNHLAVTSKDNKCFLFSNGIKVAERNYIPKLSTHTLRIGNRDGFDYNNIVMLDEFRISDIARWTEDFTPPTRPYG